MVQNCRQVKEMVEVFEVWTGCFSVSKTDELRITQRKNNEAWSISCVE